MRRNTRFFALLGIALVIPLFAMMLIPLADTSEPRYAEIARLMYESGDWITPWFAPGNPFWGKPPLSFWLQAISMHIFGPTEFAARLPSWIATLLTLGVLYRCCSTVFNIATARLAVLIYETCALSFVTSGAVLTDPFLALGATLCMTGWIMATNSSGLFWRYSFFIGLVIGLLAKGPLILVLAGGAIVPWLLFYPLFLPGRTLSAFCRPRLERRPIWHCPQSALRDHLVLLAPGILPVGLGRVVYFDERFAQN